MKFKLIAMLMLLVCLGTSSLACAEGFTVKPGDTIQKLLEDQKGKRVTLRLQGNEELAGKVRKVTNELVQLGELSGREFFDAVVEVSRISAVIVRVKE
ncbi:MAG: hypothetical protein PHF56_14130 [Desulfuromonadaceae bacterium]|nr:hypothetical protein [Desulfuromonadaceae bacterium]